MGKLLSLLSRDDSTCCSPQKYDVFLDFESKSTYSSVFLYHFIWIFMNISRFKLWPDAQPTSIEKEVYEEVQKVLLKSESILEELQFYKGAGKEIREAISTPTEECQMRAWQAVLPLVEKLKRFYLFSLELGKNSSDCFHIYKFSPCKDFVENSF